MVIAQINKFETLGGSAHDCNAYFDVGPSILQAKFTFVFLVDTHKNLSFLLDIKRVIPLRLHYFNRRIVNVLNAQEFAFYSDFVHVYSFADVETGKAGNHIFKTHPEYVGVA